MEFTMNAELVIAIVTAVVTALLGTLFKNNVVPSRLIPVQNLIIGIISTIIAIALGLFENPIIAALICIGTPFSVGGLYDLSKTKTY